MSAASSTITAAVTQSLIGNVEAEAALIGAMLIEGSILEMAADALRESDFLAAIHGRIFSAAVRERSLGRAVTPVLLKPYFEDDPALKELGGTGYLARLTADSSGLLAPKELIAQIQELAYRRRMQIGLADALERVSALAEPVADITGDIEAAITVRADEKIAEPSAGECFDNMLRGFGESVDGVLCGQIPSLDKLMGPLRPKEMIVVAARPGMGKTAASLSYSIGAAKRGHGVLFVSLEMSARQLTSRMAADMCFTHGDNSVPFHAILQERLSDAQMRRVVEAGSRAHSLPLTIVDAGSLTVERLAMIVRRHVRRMQARGHKLELVVVDYLQLLRTQHRHRAIYETVSEISMTLKGIAAENNVALMALAQLSREVEKRPDKHPLLSDLRDSGQIEQDADAVLFLMREEYYLRQSEPAPESPKLFDWQTKLGEVEGKIKFILAKRRNGTIGTATGEFHGAYQAVRG